MYVLRGLRATVGKAAQGQGCEELPRQSIRIADHTFNEGHLLQEAEAVPGHMRAPPSSQYQV